MKFNKKSVVALLFLASVSEVSAFPLLFKRADVPHSIKRHEDEHESHSNIKPHLDHTEKTDMASMSNDMNSHSANSSSVMEPSPASMHGGHHHHNWNTILDNPDLEPQQRAYWEQYDTTTFLNAPEPANKFFLHSHIALAVFAWVFLYPVSVLISTIPTTRAYLPIQTFQTIVNVLALFCLAIYGATAPRDLYPNNFYSKFSIILFFLSLVHWFSACIKSLTQWAVASQNTPMDGAEYLLANLNPESSFSNAGSSSGNPGSAQNASVNRHSQDSGHGSSQGSIDEDTINNQSRDDSIDDLEITNDRSAIFRDDDYELNETSSNAYNNSYYDEEENQGFQTLNPKQDRFIARIMSNKKVYAVVEKCELVSRIAYSCLNRPLFVIGYFYLLTGCATLFRLGLANHIYNILAHLIKGSVFFLYGILTLGRYLGAFANRGMAWNIAPGSSHDPVIVQNQAKRLQALKKKQSKAKFNKTYASNSNRASPASPLKSFGSLIKSGFSSMFKDVTMEFCECFLIFIYGASNVFLEHLGNQDGKWSHKDLQHVSIAFMYLGGGICGLIMESKTMRRLVNRLISTSRNDAQDDENSGLLNGSISINPIPAFIVFWTGVLMSQHEQALPLSTLIHMQWGYLFCIGAIFRMGTYILMFLKPPQSTVPSRPITEVIVSFCLLCGGLVFMQSNGETVEALLYRSLDAMFTLNVNVGVTALIMSWEMIAWGIKSFVASRQYRKPVFMASPNNMA